MIDMKRFDKPLLSDDQGDTWIYGDNGKVIKIKQYKDCKKLLQIGINRWIRAKDYVDLPKDIKSLVGNYDLQAGTYIFDSYDSYDNTCFIKKSDSGITYNVCLDQLRLTQND